MDKVKLKIGWIDMDVVVKTAAEDGKDKDTDLKTVCTGKVGVEPHAPVKVNGLMRCSNADCHREEKSYHPFPRGRDNGDGTFTIPNAEALAEAKVDPALVESIELTASPIEDVEAKTLPMGRFYWLAPGKDAVKKYDTFVQYIRSHPEWAFCSMYARSTAPAMYRVLVHGNLLALQELVMPELLKARPGVEVSEASEKDLAMMEVIAEAIRCDFDPDQFADTRKRVIAAALAAADPTEAGEASTPLATIHQLNAGESDFFKALRAMGKDPETVEKPSEASGTVAKKRAPRKATPTKKSA